MHEVLEVATARQMRALGRRLAGVLRAGDLVVLSGPLGAGKTTLVQGIGEGMGVRGPVTSPTFVIARVHPSLSGGPALVHADAYRLASPAEIDDLDLDASVEASVTVVEWGGGLVEGLAADRLDVTIAVASGEGTGERDADGAFGERPGEDDARGSGIRSGGDDDGGGGVRVVRLEGHGRRWDDAGHSARTGLGGAPEAI